MRRLGVLLLLLAFVSALAAQELPVPYLSGRVVDDAGLLPPDARQRLEDKLAELERQTGAQVAVLTIESLEGQPLEDYSLRVAETWKLGQQGKDNGVLLLIAEQDRKMRLEVGYGLEGQLTDLQTHVILDEILRPAFRRGDFAGGIEQGVDAIAKAVRGEEVTAPEQPAPAAQVEGPARLIFFVIFFLVVGTFSLGALSAPGCQGWFLYLFLTPFWWLFPMALGGPVVGTGAAIAWLVGFPILKAIFSRKAGKLGPGGRRGGGGWVFFPTGGGWSSRGGGFSGGGGGFSGGGGSFGGGGSSGSW